MARKLAWLCGIAVLVAFVYGIAIGHGQSPSSTTKVAGAPAAASLQPCAESTGILLDPTVFDPDMVVTHHFGNQGPALSVPAGTQAIAPHFLWWQVVNEQVASLPQGFSRLTSDPLVGTSPNRILLVIQTVETFDTANSASAFAAGFGGQAITIPAQVIVAGKLVSVSASAPQAEGLGDQGLAISMPSPGVDYPGAIQYIVRWGATATTLELIGGANLSAPGATAGFVTQALAKVQAACPTG